MTWNGYCGVFSHFVHHSALEDVLPNYFWSIFPKKHGILLASSTIMIYRSFRPATAIKLSAAPHFLPSVLMQ